MKKYVRISEIAHHNGQTVSIQCWLYNFRSSGKVRFLELRDGSVGLLQAIIAQESSDAESFEKSKNLTQESSLIVTGKIREHFKKPGHYEMDVTHLEIIQLAELNYPVSHKTHGPEFLMNVRHLWLRTPRQVAIMKIRASVIKSIRDFFDNRNFVLFDAPILTPSSCEGTSTLFATDYFGDKAYLSQSGQLYGEVGAMALGKIYVFGPTFRAEKSKTRKHLTEFWMVEPEMAFYNLEDNMNLAEEFIVTIFNDTLNRCQKELEVLGRDLSKLEVIAKGKFPRVTYDDCIELLKKNNHPFNWGDDFGAPEETKIGSLYGDIPVFIYNFPRELKSFYFKAHPDNPKLALGCDLIAPEGFGEVIGGGQREDSYDILMENVKKSGLNMEDYQWYLDLRRYGSVPHAGFGLGLERTVSWICGLEHLREAVPFPRLINYLRP